MVDLLGDEAATHEHAREMGAAAWLMALIALALMLAWVGSPPVQRTQEARVLETAREMLGRGWHDWMIPHLNGKVRVEKPPLAYWLAAIAFKIGGVSDGVGRVPFVLSGWATMLIMAGVARRFFNRRVAFLTGATLIGGMMFARYGRLAETDILATLAATAAIVSIWIGIDVIDRAANASGRGEEPGQSATEETGRVEESGQSAAEESGRAEEETRRAGEVNGHAAETNGREASAVGRDATNDARATIEDRRGAGRWFLLSGAMIGVAIMAKGLPGVFPLFYLIVTAAVRRDAKLIWRWLRSGAPVLMIVIGVPWWAYMLATIGMKTFKQELHDGIEGREHAGTFVQYFPDLLRAVLPYAILAVAAIALGVQRFWRDARLRELIVWFAAIFVPLLFNGQRQFHYLLPTLPPLAMLIAWLLDATIDRTIAHWSFMKLLFFITVMGMIIAGIALPAVAVKMRGAIARVDWIFCVAAIVAGVLPLIASSLDFTPTLTEAPIDPAILKMSRDAHRLTASILVFAIAAAIFMLTLIVVWLPTLRTSNPRTIAAEVRAVGTGPCCFYGDNISLTLLYSMRQIMPQYTSPDALRRAADGQPSLMVIAQTKSGVSPPPLPAEFEYVKKIISEDQTYEIARLRR